MRRMRRKRKKKRRSIQIAAVLQKVRVTNISSCLQKSGQSGPASSVFQCSLEGRPSNCAETQAPAHWSKPGPEEDAKQSGSADEIILHLWKFGLVLTNLTIDFQFYIPINFWASKSINLENRVNMGSMHVGIETQIWLWMESFQDFRTLLGPLLVVASEKVACTGYLPRIRLGVVAVYVFFIFFDALQNLVKIE